MSTILRIRCTPAQLAAARGHLDGTGPPVQDREFELAGTGLVDTGGGLTPAAIEALQVVSANARRLVAVSTSPGDAVPRIATVTAAASEGPYVFEAHRPDRVDLVSVGSPSSALALLDDLLLLGALSFDGVDDELELSSAAWWTLAALADAHRAHRLAAELRRQPAAHWAPVGRGELDQQVEWALAAVDGRWLLGTIAVADRSAVASAPAIFDAGLRDLAAGGLVTLTDGGVAPTHAGWRWIELLDDAARRSHLRLLHRIEGAPAEIGALTIIRTAATAVLAQHGPSGTLVLRTDPRLVGAIVRAALEVPCSAPTSAPAAPSQSVTVHTRVEVLSPDGGANRVGSLEPGATCVVESTSGGWALVRTADGTLRGWIDAAALDAGGQERS